MNWQRHLRTDYRCVDDFPDTINEARFGMANEINNFHSPTLNAGYPAMLGLKFSKGDEFPLST
jgi:hypothetical protein